ncbi:serine hydrolase [Aquimarina sp. I32.4]|uniref:serine hydrolase domain-containing protein n=1 Tax=Aquimarina sp. I32.4 TaxID=2053903 RepID=UPI000CDE8152|nr:serine hydrolase domain-containing protein [Aquimarina sp. I32.4]
MRIALYILLGVVVVIVGFFTWFFTFYLQVPELELPDNVTDEEKVVLMDKWFEELQRQNKFNGAVLISKEGKPLLIKGYGYTDYSKKEKLSIHSSLRLASVSKQFTAAGIMLLKEQGDIDYDEEVSLYIKEFPYKGVTIRHLLNQTSGVPDKYMKLAKKNKEKIGVLTNKKAVDLLIKNKPKIDFLPNAEYKYSNTNYILLARIIEVVSDVSFETYMRTHLFEPLGMKDTRVWNLLSEEKTFKNKTGGFDETIRGIKEIKPTFIDGVAGDGGVFCSVHDFVIWDTFWYQNELLSKDNLKEAFKKPVLTTGETSDYGFGWMIMDEGVVIHTGLWMAARTYIIRNTKRKTCIVILDNSSSMFFRNIVESL